MAAVANKEFRLNVIFNETLIVHGRNPLTPLDLTHIPLVKHVSVEAENQSQHIKDLHQKVRDQIIKHNAGYQSRTNKHRKQVVYKEGDLVWIHLQKERFPTGRFRKLKAHADRGEH
ncbi:hypothetical protein OSB04_un001272 [Centaurea solstitialis]|uniref:Uncharacterized protein n=1 Tax=Centaurea solstitialis TaxID=347529 RepID=A0AA38W2S3_9ASTR|nr:hypothetical protein OSB04_un001272 [Centaurea solstitialis]